MSKSSAKMQSWQIFHYCRKHLSASVLYNIFGRKKARAIDHWCEDPLTTARENGAYDPINGVKKLLSMLDDRAHFDIVRATAAYLFEDTCCDPQLEQKIIYPKSTMIEEKLPDYEAVAAFHRAIDDKNDLAGVEHLLNEAVAELERTFALYRREVDDV